MHRHFLRGPSGAIGSTTTRTRTRIHKIGSYSRYNFKKKFLRHLLNKLSSFRTIKTTIIDMPTATSVCLFFVRVPYLTVLQFGTVLGRYPVLRIRIRMFLGLPDPHPDPLVKSTDPAPNPS
jgi:hypothetical protein